MAWASITVDWIFCPHKTHCNKFSNSTAWISIMISSSHIKARPISSRKTCLFTISQCWAVRNSNSSSNFASVPTVRAKTLLSTHWLICQWLAKSQRIWFSSIKCTLRSNLSRCTARLRKSTSFPWCGTLASCSEISALACLSKSLASRSSRN